MGRLIYSAIASLDGYVADADGDFSWSAPDEEVHAYVNQLARPIGIHLYGRRMYEVLSVWETFGLDADEPAVIRDFGQIWRGADKIVYSATLPGVDTTKTTLKRQFDPDEVRRLVADASGDVTIGGPTLAAAALRDGLVDELQVFFVPHIVGGGQAFLPDAVRLSLRLLDDRRFRSGVEFLRYAVEPSRS